MSHAASTRGVGSDRNERLLRCLEKASTWMTGLPAKRRRKLLPERRSPDDVTASAIYRALCSRNCDMGVARKVVEGVRDSLKWKWEKP